MIGPCSDDDGAFLASGTTSFHANSNDDFGVGRVVNSFGDRGRDGLTGADGTSYTYSWHFHGNSDCYTPEGGPPACVVDVGTLTAG